VPTSELTGDRVRLRGYVRTDGVTGGYAGLWMRVDDAAGMLYLENMQQAPIQGTQDWHRVEIMAPLTADAVRLSFGAIMTGEGNAWFDDLTLEAIDTSTWPLPAAEIMVYLDDALDVMRQQSIKRQTIDWDALRNSMRNWARGAQTMKDSYFSIRATLSRLKDRHSNFFTPERAAALRETSGPTRTPSPPPTGMVLDGSFGYLNIPFFVSMNATQATRCADDVQTLIAGLDSSELCGWIVDLRQNGGGNVFPMIAGVGPILGEGNAGGGITADGTRMYYTYRDGQSGIGDSAAVRVSREPYTLISPMSSVAVLIGPQTGSSGEQTALAFIGRPATRTFGLPSAGLTTGNATHILSDGAMLNLTVTTMTDRSGRAYGEAIEPDERVEADPPGTPLSDQIVVKSAIAWLKQQDRCRIRGP
jgi:C-terminal processing protease CtpA/Prc